MGGPDRGCPHDMDDVTCEDFKATCNRDATSQLTCFRMIIDYCEDHDDQMCHEGIMSDDDDGGKIFKAFFDYEDGEITAAEFMDIFVEPHEHVYPMHVAPSGAMKDMWLSKTERV